MNGYGAVPDRYALALNPSREPLDPYGRPLDGSRSPPSRGRGLPYPSVEALDAFRAFRPLGGEARDRYIEVPD
jgi:hypothetical protein